MVLKTFISLNKYTPNNRMDCSELLRIRLANTLYCRQQNICGNETPVQTPVIKSFTIFLDYSSGTAISSVYIPPGLYSSTAYPSLILGGTFTNDVGTDLVFIGGTSIQLQNTAYAFVTTISASGCIRYTRAGTPPVYTPKWQSVAAVNFTPVGGIYYLITSPNMIKIQGLELAALNGGNLSSYTTEGPGAGFLASITLFYI